MNTIAKLLAMSIFGLFLTQNVALADEEQANTTATAVAQTSSESDEQMLAKANQLFSLMLAEYEAETGEKVSEGALDGNHTVAHVSQ